MSENTGILLETKDLSKYFTAKKGLLNRNPSVVKAVDHVSLSVRKGETLGLVGESGCGKSTLGRTILRLIPATEGQVMYNGEDILTYDKKKMWEMRRKLQIIFQDPYSSLNPRMTVYDLISAPLEVYKVGTKEERREMVEEILQEVGLDKQYLNRQRIILEGDVPSAYNPPSGCKFHTRCPYATDRCRQEAPVLQEVEKGHKAACHRALELA